MREKCAQFVVVDWKTLHIPCVHQLTHPKSLILILILYPHSPLASFPGPAQLSVACSTEKRGEPGIFSHVSDVTTNEKLMNVGGLTDNGVIAHALIVPAKMVREFVCLMPSNRALLLPCRVYVFANG